MFKQIGLGLLLAASFAAHSADVSSATFGYCAQQNNRVVEGRALLDVIKSNLLSLENQTTSAQMQVAALAWNKHSTNGYYAYEAARQQYNVYANEYNSAALAFDNRVDQFNINVLSPFRNTCAVPMSLSPTSPVWREWCEDTNQYSAWCRKFQ